MKNTSILPIRLILAIFLLFPFLSACNGDGNGKTDQNGENGSASGTGKAYTISGSLFACGTDSMRLYQVTGWNIRQVDAALVSKEDGKKVFEMDGTVPETGFYLLGPDMNNLAGIILGGEEGLQVTGDCNKFAQTMEVRHSALNDQYMAMLQGYQKYATEEQRIMENMELFSESNPNQMANLKKDLDRIQMAQANFMDSIRQAGGFMGKVASINLFWPYKSKPVHEKYPNDLQYIAHEFFAPVDLSDSSYAEIPMVYDKFSQFTTTLATRGVPDDTLKKYLDKVLYQTPEGSRLRKIAWMGIIRGLDQANHRLFIDYGNGFLAAFDTKSQQDASLVERIEQKKKFLPGSEPPAFELTTTDGRKVGPSSFKGKILLLDFWASWCAPCRAENPNNLAMYRKYKNNGFEILGISIDQNEADWKKAIQQDQLPWPQTRDANAEVQQKYDIQYIPYTVLLDREGKILKVNLRGPGLRKELEQIFGN